jgi:hypothetical protein
MIYILEFKMQVENRVGRDLVDDAHFDNIEVFKRIKGHCPFGIIRRDGNVLIFILVEADLVLAAAVGKTPFPVFFQQCHALLIIHTSLTPVFILHQRKFSDHDDQKKEAPACRNLSI